MLFKYFFIVILSLSSIGSGNPEYNLKREITTKEIGVIRTLAAEMATDDQRYRTPIVYGTTDPVLMAKIDSIGEADGALEMYKYIQTLDVELSLEEKDSLYSLQQELDFRNHMILQGWLEEFGWLPKEVLGEYHYIQQVLLFHPHVDNGDNSINNVRAYLHRYSALLIEEVEIGRMPAKLYATFYDNMCGKILGEPQLYGTNQRYNEETQSAAPPLIESIEKTNQAREELGLDPLTEGQYEEMGN